MSEGNRHTLYRTPNVAKHVTPMDSGSLRLSKETTDPYSGQPYEESSIRLNRQQADNLRRNADYLAENAFDARETKYVDLDSGKHTVKPKSGVYARVSDDSAYFQDRGIDADFNHDVDVRQYDNGNPSKEGARLNPPNFHKLNKQYLSPKK